MLGWHPDVGVGLPEGKQRIVLHVPLLTTPQTMTRVGHVMSRPRGVVPGGSRDSWCL